MFECAITVLLPIHWLDDPDSPAKQVIATYDFDPGLEKGDIIYVNNASFVKTKRDGKPVESSGPKFSFQSQVLRREYAVNVGAPDKFLLMIEVEIADKEVIPKIVEYFETTFPRQCKRVELPIGSEGEPEN